MPNNNNYIPPPTLLGGTPGLDSADPGQELAYSAPTEATPQPSKKPGFGAVLKEILKQFALAAPQSVGDAVQQNLTPELFAEHQTTLRKQMELAQQLHLHSVMTPYEKAQVELAKLAQTRQEKKDTQADEDRDEARRDKMSEFLLQHPELKPATPQAQGSLQRTQTGGQPPTDPNDMMAQLFGLPQTSTSVMPNGQVSLPQNAVQVGDKYFTAPPQRMITPPPGSVIEKLFGKEPIVQDKLSNSLIDEYVKSEGKRVDKEAHTKALQAANEQGQAFLGQLKDYGEDPDVINVFRKRLENAANQDSANGSGSTSEMNGVLKDIGTFISTNNPRAKQQARKEKLDDHQRALEIAKTVNAKPEADPEDVNSAVDMALHNPDNMDIIKSTYSKNSKFMEAVGKEFLRRGVDFEKLTSQAKESREYARVAQALLPPLLTKINKADADGKLGALASRINAFTQGKVGAGDPEYSQLAGEIDLMRKLVGKIHLGVRGAGSPQNAEAMKTKLNEGTMDAATLKAGLAAYKTYVDVYAKMGMRDYSEVGGGDRKPAGGGDTLGIKKPGEK